MVIMGPLARSRDFAVSAPDLVVRRDKVGGA